MDTLDKTDLQILRTLQENAIIKQLKALTTILPVLLQEQN